METNLSKAIDITNDTARYDESVKELLADKQVLARILKYSVEEFAELSLDEIIKSISEPDIAGIRVEPGMTNLGKVEKQSEEDFVPGEGKNIYDIRFVAYLGTEMIKFLINVEAQKSTKHYDLGYHLDNRIIFYLSRMISAQKEIEFFNSDYDNIKAVRSIWICMDSNADEDSINRIRFVQENVESSKNYLIAMLEELLKKGDKEKKKKNLSSNFGLIMTEETIRRIDHMCNLSDLIVEQGIEQGIEQGNVLHLIGQVCKKMKKGKTVTEIAEDLEEPAQKIEQIYKAALKYNANEKEKDKIYAELN
ncbi:MAG: hypothetical protein EGP77_13235 [Lachnospiraceae bacterium]|nr:hypothetical protein [Lachnospiraceae bacterium]